MKFFEFQNLSFQSGNNDSASSGTQAGRQNNEALPNPWGGGGGANTNQQANQANNANTSSGGAGAGGAGGDGAGGMFGNMNPDMMQQSMEMMRNNPEMMRSMLQAVNPQLANNPQMERVCSIFSSSIFNII